MTNYSRSRSHSANEPSQRELDLADLYDSDEDVESLLSGGADVDDLIAAGALDGGDDERAGWQVVEGVELPERPVLTEVEVLAQIEERNKWLVAHGYLSADRWSKKGYSNASSQPL